MKILKWIYNNFLFLATLFLLVFIPLYPKLPIINVVHTWVYVRAEDFVVSFVVLAWIVLLFRRKISLKTPLTMPLFIFWLVGAIATFHGVLLIFPGLANVFPNVAFLSMLRRIEYASMFFVAYAALKDKKTALPLISWIIVLTLLAVALYGIGQRYLGFPAFLTMNEEFAKGIPIQLSALSRVPSTFAGHYDLAAYLVLVIPIVVSLLFGFKNWLIRLFFLVVTGFGLIVLFMTVSRVSFFVLFISIALVLFLQKRRWVMLSLPIIGIVFAVLLLVFTPRLLDRFSSTVKETDVLIDAKTGDALGNIKDVTSTDFKDKIIKKRVFVSQADINADIETAPGTTASAAAIVPFELLPASGVQLVPPNASTGENLPQGTGYMNLAMSPVKKQLGNFFYTRKAKDGSMITSELTMFTGNFLIKRASAYDLSLTTRYQGEWPNALAAFKRNIFLGSGYASISLAIDNSYLRMLGEVGGFGFIAFFAIFVAAGLYIKKVMQEVDSPLVRSFVIGFCAGLVGLAFNATLIDVFEASKIAFYLWLLMGITLGVLHSYQKQKFAIYSELKKVATSNYALIFYLAVIATLILSPMIGNYFSGDDFTWLKWAADCTSGFLNLHQCPSVWDKLLNYFTQSDGFFYRPGTKAYFLLMYSVFWLNPVAYHIVSLSAHILVVVLLFIFSKKVLRDSRLATLVSFLFVMISGYSEVVFWISSTGYLFNAIFILLGLLLFIAWEEKKRIIYLILSILSIGFSLLFHELGMVAPLFILLYKYSNDSDFIKNIKLDKKYYLWLFVPDILYLLLHLMAKSHWFSGDYSYNLLKFPLNVVGNFIGYFALSVAGPSSMRFYEVLRNISKANFLITIPVALLAFYGAYLLYKKLISMLGKEDKRIVVFSVLFSIIALLPFLGLGNITSRYSYLASFGFLIIFAFLIKKGYEHLLDNGRDIAMTAITLIISVFLLLHIIQIQQIHGDWHESGKRINNFFVAVENQYSDNWSADHLDLHFVNVPIKTGSAWIFPVGLNDALWFILKNPNVRVYQWDSVDKALSSVSNPLSQKVFLFDDQGNLTEQFKNQKLQAQ
ncbi:hypothetical protein HZA75_00995 [Candidatus Roizmanbacteria bacterium]|nr:hypothetical protein [Candidatus Roizmanbacteria bacterium]